VQDDKDDKDDIRELAADLVDLLRICGRPSLRRVSAVARKRGTERHMPHSTVDNALKGERVPQLRVVLWIVQAARDCAAEDGILVDQSLFDRIAWQDRWDRAERASARVKTEQPKGPELMPSWADESVPPADAQMQWLPARHSRYVLIANDGPLGSRIPWLAGAAHAMREAIALAAPWLTIDFSLNQTHAEVTHMLSSAVTAAADVLFVHLLGHGYLDDQNHLHMPTVDTDLADISAMSIDVSGMLRQLQGHTRASAVVLIVDTNFASSSFPMNPKPGDHAYVLAAAGEYGLALDGADSLTAYLTRVLAAGSRNFGWPLLTMEHVAIECSMMRLKTHWSGNHTDYPITIRRVGEAHRISMAINAAAGAPGWIS
jgi:hypothetical protein